MSETDIIFIVLYSVVGVYLMVMSVIDIKNKSIPLIPGAILLGLIVTVLLIIQIEPLQYIAGMSIGVILYIISRLSREAVGRADALVYLITGCVLGGWGNSQLLLISLVLCSIVGGFLLMRKKANRKTRLAFVPFTAAGYMLLMIGTYIGGMQT